MAEFETQPRPAAADLGYEVETVVETAGLKPAYPLIEDAGQAPVVVEAAPTTPTPVVEPTPAQAATPDAPKPVFEAEPTTLSELEQSLYGSV